MPTSHETPNHPTQRKTAEHLSPDIKNHTTIQNICLSSQDLNKRTSIHTGMKQTKKNTSTVPTHIIVVGPDDSKTMMAIGRIGADMRSAKERHCTGATVLHQRDNSKMSSAGRQQSRSARSPQNAKKAVQQREPDLHHHQTLKETTTRTQNRVGTKTLTSPIVTSTQ